MAAHTSNNIYEYDLKKNIDYGRGHSDDSHSDDCAGNT